MSPQPSADRPENGVSKEFMRRLPLFADLAEEDLQQLFEMASMLHVAAGEQVIGEGDAGDALYIVVEGELEVSKREGEREVVLARRGPGEFIGELSLIEQAPRSASVHALQESRLLVISRAAFQTLLSCSPSAPQTLLRAVTSRLRSTESLLMQQEKLAALGTLAAGLAHELNNPAAAILRNSEHLREAMDAWVGAAAEIGALAFEPRQMERLRVLWGEAAQQASSPIPLDPLACSLDEARVQSWLEEHDIEPAWQLAPVLVPAGWDRTTLEQLTGEFSAAQLPAVVRWLAAGAEMHGLIKEVGQSAEAIAKIIGAVKSYSFLDQAPVQEVDLHEGLESTLIMLRHRLKQGVRVVRDYAEELPRIQAYGSELNQVWTNLMGNAIDAMEGSGELRLRTCARDEEVVVEITDSGPGVPPEIQPRIFEPFFTTKAPGKGTGLGLHLVHNIVVHRHRGQIQLTSRPGETRFRVTLPVRLAGG